MRYIYIDIFSLTRIIKKAKFKILLAMIISFGIGGVIAFETPKVYSTTVILASESVEHGGAMENIGDLLGWKNYSAYSDAIYPEIFPKVVSSKAFALPLLDIPVRTSASPDTLTYRKYLATCTKIPFWMKPKIWLKKLNDTETPNFAASSSGTAGNLRILSEKDEELIEALSATISCEIDKVSGLIKISASAQDPFVAAIMTDTITARLTRFIEDYRQQKAEQDITFLQAIAHEAKKEYDNTTKKYVDFIEKNAEAVSTEITSEEQKLEDIRQLKFDVYTSLTEQLIDKQATKNYSTPIYAQVQSSIITGEPVSRSRAVTMVMASMLLMIIFFIFLIYYNRKKIFIS